MFRRLCVFRGCLLWLIGSHPFFFLNIDGDRRDAYLGTTQPVLLEMLNILAKMSDLEQSDLR